MVWFLKEARDAFFSTASRLALGPHPLISSCRVSSS
jgi:hypothetical protein